MGARARIEQIVVGDSSPGRRIPAKAVGNGVIRIEDAVLRIDRDEPVIVASSMSRATSEKGAGDARDRERVRRDRPRLEFGGGPAEGPTTLAGVPKTPVVSANGSGRW